MIDTERADEQAERAALAYLVRKYGRNLADIELELRDRYVAEAAAYFKEGRYYMARDRMYDALDVPADTEQCKFLSACCKLCELVAERCDVLWVGWNPTNRHPFGRGSWGYDEQGRVVFDAPYRTGGVALRAEDLNATLARYVTLVDE